MCTDLHISSKLWLIGVSLSFFSSRHLETSTQTYSPHHPHLPHGFPRKGLRYGKRQFTRFPFTAAAGLAIKHLRARAFRSSTCHHPRNFTAFAWAWHPTHKSQFPKRPLLRTSTATACLRSSPEKQFLVPYSVHMTHWAAAPPAEAAGHAACEAGARLSSRAQGSPALAWPTADPLEHKPPRELTPHTEARGPSLRPCVSQPGFGAISYERGE